MRGFWVLLEKLGFITRVTPSHVTKTVSACFAVLRQLRSIRRSVPRSVLQSLVTSLVLTRLDYGNSTIAGIPVPSQAASVGDELSCPASLRLVEVRPCRSTSPSTPLVDGSGANRFQARSPCCKCQHGACTLGPCR